jgi:D-amino-acid dehydrogenase
MSIQKLLPSEAEAPDVVVLGAGILGISTAYFLAKAGRSVLVVDQLPGPGLDTSFANGGQISVCHAEPWATPKAPLKVLRWLMRDDAPLLFRPRLDPWQWWWLMGWLVECLPQRTKRNTVEILELALHSRGVLQRIRAEEGLVYDHETRGILHFFRDQQSLDGAAEAIELLSQHGCPLERLDRDRIVALEPALAPIAGEIAGGTYSADDESGDAYQFTVALAEVCAKLGVKFLYGHQVVGLPHDRHRRVVDSVRLKNLATSEYRELTAGSYVLALGAFSAPVARPLGLHLNIYPAKGYSVTVPIGTDGAAPRLSVTDDKYKTVFTRLGDRLRVAGTAELADYDRDLSPVRCRAMLEHTRQMFPQAGDYGAARFWSGLRPTTPSNLPYLGRSSYRNLYLNTGHGTLGWTMGPGSGERVARIITG